MAADSWRDRRRDAVSVHAAALERRRDAETREARDLVAAFAREMAGSGQAPERLRARVPDGRATYRTRVVGWYIRRNRSLGVGADGAFYVLDVPASPRSRLLGADVAPSNPPLVVGRGGRDGESMPLAGLLRQRLDAGTSGW